MDEVQPLYNMDTASGQDCGMLLALMKCQRTWFRENVATARSNQTWG